MTQTLEQKREAGRLAMAAWRARNPDKIKALAPRRRETAYLRNYGLSVVEAQDMLCEQGGGCAICDVPLKLPHKNTHVDHDPKTKLVRGILCRECNIGIGMFKHDWTSIIRAVSYLRVAWRRQWELIL